MAGIGFELEKILNKKTLGSHFQAYGYAALIASGPWLLSMISILILAAIGFSQGMSQQAITVFLITITYLMAMSLVVSGCLQLVVTRFVSDLFYLNKTAAVIPNVLGAMVVISLIAAPFSVWLAGAFEGFSRASQWLVGMSFITLCNLWLVVLMMGTLQRYFHLVFVLAAGYSLMVFLVLFHEATDFEGLMGSFFLCHLLMLTAIFMMVIKQCPSDRVGFCFEFFRMKTGRERKLTFQLMGCGLFYALGIWVDKWLFWYFSNSSESVVGFFRASMIYDLPIFLANLSIIPGLSIFLLSIETSFARRCGLYFEKMNQGSTLSQTITHQKRNDERCKVQLLSIVKGPSGCAFVDADFFF